MREKTDDSFACSPIVFPDRAGFVRRNVSTTLVSSSSEKGVMASAGFNLATRHMLKQGTPALAELLCKQRRSVWPIQVAPQRGQRPGGRGQDSWSSEAPASWPMTSSETQRPPLNRYALNSLHALQM